jgi:hypothetical protein
VIELHPDKYGGGYVDASGTTLHVLFVGDEGSARNDLEALIPVGASVSWERVSRSYRDLDRIRGEIIVLWTQGRSDQISEVSVSIPTNSVVVGMPVLRADLVDELQRLYGDAVTVKNVPQDEPA